MKTRKTVNMHVKMQQQKTVKMPVKTWQNREYTHKNVKNCNYARENAKKKKPNTPMKTRKTAYASEIFQKKTCENARENIKKNRE